MSAVVLSHSSDDGYLTGERNSSHSDSANRVVFISPSLLFSAGSEPPRPAEPERSVLSGSDGGAREGERGEEDAEREEDEPPEGKQKPGEEEEEDEQRLKGKQSAGEAGDDVVGGGRLPPDHTPGNPTCNLFLFISREIGLCCTVTCSYDAV